jgi:transcriptional regulator with XRE-family HTH domain
MTERYNLGEKLRKLRKAHKLSGIKLASKIGVSQSNISRIESGILCPDMHFIRRFIHALGMRGREAAHLIEYAENFLVDFNRWGSEEPGVIAKLQKIAKKSEDNSTLIEVFSCDLIPGILQVPEYMDALFQTLGEADEKQRKLAIQGRLERQRAFDGGSRVCKSVICEHAVRVILGSRNIMAKQRRYIIPWLYGKNGHHLKILPVDKKIEISPMSSFSIYDRRYVSIETYTRGINIWADTEIREYCRIFDSLYHLAVGGEEAESILRAL